MTADVARPGAGARARRWLAPVAVVLMAAWAWRGLGLGLDRFQRASTSVRVFAAESWPPDFSIWPDAWAGLVETMQIAVLATLLGLVLSLPLAVLSASTLFPAAITVPARLLATAVRVPPSLLLALLMVILIGLGPLAGVLAMGLYSMGFLAKLQYEALEGVPRDALDAVRVMRANRFQVAWHVALPEAANALRSQVLFMLEYNVRASTVLGFVGAGGIGHLLNIYRQFFDYDRILAALILLFAAVVLIDAASYLIRRRFLETDAPRIRWRDVLFGWGGPTPRR